MVNEELERACAELRKTGANWALLALPENVTYTSHWEVPVQFGPMTHLSYAPPLALVGVTEQACLLLVHNYYAEAARTATTFDEVLSYDLVPLFPPYQLHVTPRDNFIAMLRVAVERAGLNRPGLTLAIEDNVLPALALQTVSEACPGLSLVAAGPALAAARRTKTEREIGLLRATAEVINAGQKELIRQCQQAGQSDFAMWAAITEAMNVKAGRTLFISGELVAGLRCREIAPGGPVGYITRPGDLARLDVSPRLDGYWGDLTNTLVIGGVEPTAKQLKYKRAARDGFYAAVEMLRPGKRACDAYQAARAAFANYGLEPAHYLGHQIGLTVNEGPWLVPSDETAIEAGMVFSIESGSYEGTTGKVGARVEKSVVVRESRPEIFPDFDWVF